VVTLPMVLAGGAGVISVIGEGFPKQFSTMVRFGLERRVDDAYRIHYQLADAIDMIFEQGNPAGIKEIFHVLGLCENVLRLPLVNVNEDLAKRIRLAVKKIVN
ncbi:MAG: dihydrodipicolinate synthase family protein, partial [Flavobacterium sp.]|nr:dihydrodipicolinate synthase family protein [Flavobacterium sp.]